MTQGYTVKLCYFSGNNWHIRPSDGSCKLEWILLLYEQGLNYNYSMTSSVNEQDEKNPAL